MKKPRADQHLVNLGLASSRTQAQALIMAGQVYHGTLRIEKAGMAVAPDTVLNVKSALHPWVSRGGLKLAGGLEHFGLSPAGLIAADIGASTGGFTDVLLSRGASKVYAVDVGTGQLAWKLQQDPRVIRLDGTNARHLTAEQIPEAPQVIVCDASFISLTIVLPAILTLAAAGAWLIALIKPQFEVGKDNVGKGGIVRDENLHQAVCEKISTWLQNEMGWRILGVTPSPITGAEGNKEFLVAAQKP
jgi:23S rRNA (cytidine1920-2'-O)/16S rRNA (cytidine1409-2'-O)-methyltransferase